MQEEGICWGSKTTYDQILIPRAIDHIHGRQLQRRPPYGVHEGFVRRHLFGDQRHRRLKPDVRRPLRQDHPHVDLLVRHALAHARPFQERHFQHIATARWLLWLDFPQRFLQRRVPADAETVFPPPKDRVPRLELEVRFTRVAAEAARGDVPDVVRVVWV